MKKLLVFGGTKEGRRFVEALMKMPVELHVCVATEYGASLLPDTNGIKVYPGRMGKEEMAALMKKENFDAVIDATHPFAVLVTEEIQQAAKKEQIPYYRLKREIAVKEEKQREFVLFFESIEEIVTYLQETKGNVFVTTGSKELFRFLTLPDAFERVYARVLSIPEVITECAKLGFLGSHLFCMQGPFSKEMNVALLKQTKASYLVTKTSGETGGFFEKLSAAKQCNVTVLAVGKKIEEFGYSFSELLSFFGKEELHEELCPFKPEVGLIGIGMGGEKQLTLEASEWIETSDFVIGADRMLQQFALEGKRTATAYLPDSILQCMKENSDCKKISVLFSGDLGFYSGAKKLIPCLADYRLTFFSGIASPVYFLNKIGKSWESVRLLSMHGKKCNLLYELRHHKDIFLLLGSNGVEELCKKLILFGLENINVTIGENLSYPEERICVGTPKELLKRTFGSLCVAFLEQEKFLPVAVHASIPDEAFLRGNVPMTKEEIRSISLSKLGLSEKDILYDIGAGTGSVSIEAALHLGEGMVYAIEKKAEAISLIRENKEKFQVENLEVIEGFAPEAFEELPVPTHAFLGGTTGQMKPILLKLLEKNPFIRIVINVIALETLAETLQILKELPVTKAEYVQVSIAKARQVGSYHLMQGSNPITIISCSGSLAQT